METYSLVLIFIWLVPLWLLGWLFLPLSRFFFGEIIDGGLAAGRVLALVVVSLIAFWAASLRLAPLNWSPLLWTLPLVAIIYTFFKCTRDKEYSRGVGELLRQKRRGLILSDVAFVSAFLFFVALRLCRPEINEFEKPMDSAIIGSLARSDFLPAENPWFAGADFTNYYYYGHFMAALLKRTFNTPLPYAYNLIQPAFCAFFISTLWALCATLCKSTRYGTLSFIMVGLCGNFEPLRQWLTPSATLNRSTSFPFLDWWSTSRVIPHTINEYPFFTLALGDAHAHFFALSLSALLISACYGLLLSSSSMKYARTQTARIAAIGIILSVILMTNAWDFPLHCLLVLLAVTFYLRKNAFNEAALRIKKPTFVPDWGLLLLPFLIAVGAAAPFLNRFKPGTGGIAVEIWSPPRDSFFLLWGGFLTLWAIVLCFDKTYKENQIDEALTKNTQKMLFTLAILLVAIGFYVFPDYFIFLLPIGLLYVTLVQARRCFSPISKCSQAPTLLYILAITGIVALISPHLFYIRGYFGGDLRHQDTVFKFGQQTWIFLGLAASCGFMSWQHKHSYSSTLAKIGVLGIWLTPALASTSVAYSRLAPLTGISLESKTQLSLNGARFLPSPDQNVLMWLESHAPQTAYLIEAVGRDDSGNFVGAYGVYGRAAALTGVPAYIGWPQHAGFWGASHDEIKTRLLITESIFQQWPTLPSNINSPMGVPGKRATFIFYGTLEQRIPNPNPGTKSFTPNPDQSSLKELYRSGNSAFYEIRNPIN